MKIRFSIILIILTLVFSSCFIPKFSIEKSIDSETGIKTIIKEKWWGTGSGYTGDGPSSRNTKTMNYNPKGTLIQYEFKKVRIEGCSSTTFYSVTKKYNESGKLVERAILKDSIKTITTYNSSGKLINTRTINE